MSVNEQPVYEVRLRSRRVQRELNSLQETDNRRVVAKIAALAYNARPQGCEELYDDIYRVSVGDVRIIYLVDEGIKRIDVGGIRRRGERTYKGLEDLFR